MDISWEYWEETTLLAQASIMGRKLHMILHPKYVRGTGAGGGGRKMQLFS